MNKKILLILLLAVFISAVLCAEGLNSTYIISGIDNNSIQQTKKYILLFIVFAVVVFYFYLSGKVKKNSLASIKLLSVFWVLFLGAVIILFFQNHHENIHHEFSSVWEEKRKQCYSNIRILQYAIEKYNMEHSKKICSLNEKIAKDILLKEGYLETIPECPEYDHSGLMPLISKKKIGFYYKNLGDLTKNGLISCGTYGSGSSSDKDNWKYHGTISGFCRKQEYTKY